MNFSRHKKLFILGALLALTIAIPLTVYLTGENQDTRSKAQASTTLSFTPVSSQASPIQKNVNETFPLSISIDPGANSVSIVTLEIQYDPTSLEVSGINGFSPNTTLFPITLEGPNYSPGFIRVSLSIGSDPTRAITSVSSIGTITFKSINGTSSPTQITYGPQTKVFSVGASDQSGENVLSSSSPAVIQIGNPVSPTPVISPTATPTPQPSPTATPTLPIPTSTPIPTIPISQAILNFKVFLHGIGNSGDNSNPGNFSSSNKNPFHPNRVFGFELFDRDNTKVYESNINLVYNTPLGGYTNETLLPTSLSSGTYTLYIRGSGFLRKRNPNVVFITTGERSVASPVHLVTGDTDNNNSLNILDYSTLLDCGYGDLDPLPMTDPDSTFNDPACQAHTGAANADLNDNGIISRSDFNLFIREIAVQNGD